MGNDVLLQSVWQKVTTNQEGRTGVQTKTMGEDFGVNQRKREKEKQKKEKKQGNK